MEDHSTSSESESLIETKADPDLNSVFAQPKSPQKAELMRAHRPKGDNRHHTSVPYHALPKMYFPKFDGTHPKICIDNCANYFSIYVVPTSLWLSSTTMHMEGNASKWWQVYKQQHTNITWLPLCMAIEQEFGADDY